MSLVLSVLGAIAALAGISTIGFGIPINEFSLGNTLILAGTTILAAGLVLLGLAAAVAQLKRIEVALSPAPFRGRPAVRNWPLRPETRSDEFHFQPGHEPTRRAHS